MTWSDVKEWPREHKLALAGCVLAFLGLVAAWLDVPGMPKFFHLDTVAKSESTHGASSAGQSAAPPAVEQSKQPSPVLTKGQTPVVSEPKPTEREPAPQLSILYPKHDNDPVGPTSKVSIEYRNIPLSQHLWLIVETPQGGSWPHGRCVPDSSHEIGISLIERKRMSDSWETSPGQEITFGGLHEAESVHQHFTIHLVAVDQEENERLIGLQQEICKRQFTGQGTFVPARGVSESKRVVFRTY
jgi:hypothetical protein